MVSWLLSSFVTSSLQVLIEKIANMGIFLYNSVSDVDYKLKRLERTLFRVQSIIHDAEDNQRNDKAWQLLVRDLESLAYDADDLIDEIAIKVSGLHGGTRDYKDQVSELLLSLFKVSSAPSMNTIQIKMDDILKEMESLCISKSVQGKGMHLSLTEGKLQSSSLSDEPHAFGRATVRRKIINMLLTLEDSEGNDVSVISIVGMVGVGKTTLAQLVYNYNYHIHVAFDLQMWVSVSKDFNVIMLTKSIIEAATGEPSPLSNLDQLQLKLRKLILGKKFMLVLDDVWNEKQLEWNLMLKPLRVGIKGSIIIVTTRSHVVSSMVGTRRSCYLKCLSNEHCWSLVQEKALENINLDAVPNLIAIGKEIARKCKGLPLAAKTLGVLLHSRIDEGVWKNILTSKIWDLPDVQNKVHHELRSSYHHLPAHLKHCFAYCSLFPENYHFERDVLVRMWMAEGFVQVEGSRPMEDTGRDYFEQLLSMSFFEEENGKYYNMHDAVNHFAKSVSSEKFFRMENTDLHINSDTRHSSILCEDIKPTMFEGIYNCKGLHTLLMSGKYGTSIKEVPFALFQKLGRLRVLDLSHTMIEELSGSIGNLRHLRYLDLSKTLLRCLPETIHQLCSLQTLRVVNCSMFLYLPKGIEKLTNLQHLELGRNIQLTSMPQGIGRLKKLQTLSEFVVGPDWGQIKELEGMNNIRGTLRIKQLEKVNDPVEAHGAKLANKRYIDKLEFQWSSTISELREEHVLNNLRPHENLSELTLRGYGGFMFPTWMSNPLFAKLTSICLYECENCLLLPSLGKLPKLSSLKLGGMHALQEVRSNLLGSSDGVAFQSLKTLELRDMENLASWSGVLDLHMSCLLELTIIKCPSLISMPSLHNLGSIKKLIFENCPQLQSFTSGKLSNSVQSLLITACPILTERFDPLGGMDWINIRHIPMIEMDGESV